MTNKLSNLRTADRLARTGGPVAMFRPLTVLGLLLVLAVFLFGAATVDAQTPTSTIPEPPTVSSALVDATTLTLTFDTTLDADSEPLGRQFTVKATRLGGTPRTIDGTGTADVSGKTVTVTLASAVAEGETVTVSYSKPTENPLRSATGNVNVAAFTDRTVSNLTSVADYTVVHDHGPYHAHVRVDRRPEPGRPVTIIFPNSPTLSSVTIQFPSIESE